MFVAFWYSGIGIVNAIEVVNAFPEEDGLQQFRDWIESPDPTILGKFEVHTGPTAKRNELKVSDNENFSKSNTEELPASHENNSQAQEQNQAADYIREKKQIFMDKHVNRGFFYAFSFWLLLGNGGQ